MLSNRFDSTYIIIIDDLERMSENILLKEIFGVIEELKKCNYVKVIVIANLNELNPQNIDIYHRYSEKVIDRVYHITELPEKIEWGKLGIHAGFAEDFLLKHNVKNLRTMVKAQNLYDDVKLYCSEDFDELFLKQIRLICFAVVVEDIEKLYFREGTENNEQPLEAFFQSTNNQLDHRIYNYVANIKTSSSLVGLIIDYYNNDRLITSITNIK